MIVSAVAAAVVADHARRHCRGRWLILIGRIAGLRRSARCGRSARHGSRRRFDVPLLITTLLLNYVAALFAAYLVAYPLRDLRRRRRARRRPSRSPTGAQLPYLAPGRRASTLGVLRAARAAARRMVAPAPHRARLRDADDRPQPLFADYGGVDGRRTVLADDAHQRRGLRARRRRSSCSASTTATSTASITGAGLRVDRVHRGAARRRATRSRRCSRACSSAALEVGAAGMERRTEIPLQIVDILQAAIILIDRRSGCTPRAAGSARRGWEAL